MNAYLGIDTPTTTKIRRIGLHEVVIMIDSGATHNLLGTHVVIKAKLPLQSEKRFQVLLGTSVVVESLGVCPQVPVMIQDTLFTIDFVTLEKGRVYMILRVQWLRKLGKCTVDWELMSFLSCTRVSL